MKPSFCAQCIRETHRLTACDYLGRTVWLCSLCSMGYEDPRYDRPDGRVQSRSHCPHGHPWNDENTHILRRRGYEYKVCRACNRERARERHAQRRAATPTPGRRAV